MSTPEVYDVEAALDALALARRRVDPLTRETARIGDSLASSMQIDFPTEDLELVGRAMLVTVARVGALGQMLPSESDRSIVTLVGNLIAFGGQRLVLDAREAEKAARRIR